MSPKHCQGIWTLSSNKSYFIRHFILKRFPNGIDISKPS